MGDTKSINDLESWLLGSISHDMRSPFSSMIGVLQLITDEYSTMDDAVRQDFIKDLLGSSRRQLLILDCLAFMSREVRRTIHPQHSPVLLRQVLELGHARLESLGQEFQSSWHYDLSPGMHVSSDPQLLELMVVNTACYLLGQNTASPGLMISAHPAKQDGDSDGLVRSLVLEIALTDACGTILSDLEQVFKTRPDQDPPSVTELTFHGYIAGRLAGFLGFSLTFHRESERIHLIFTQS